MSDPKCLEEWFEKLINPEWLQEWFDEYPFNRVDAASPHERGIMRLLAHIRELRATIRSISGEGGRLDGCACVICRGLDLLDREAPPEVKT